VKQKLLVLDLDETLIFATEDPLATRPDATVADYYIYNRPFVREFLEFCLAEFDVAVWTSSTEGYAEGVVRHLFGNSPDLQFVWARERCTRRFLYEEQVYVYVKNLKKVKNLGYGLENIIVVDDSPEKWSQQYGNLVRVSEFLGDPSDTELKELRPYLIHLKRVPNVRGVEKRGWREGTGWPRV
jgi:RNA polymerase II subunit A small phosphatase-like protein